MIVHKPSPHFLAVDTIEAITLIDARALLADGKRARGGYIERVTPAELAAQLSAGLAFFPIAEAGDFNGATIVQRMQALGLPNGTRVLLDIEGITDTAPVLIAKLNACTALLGQYGFKAAGYFGSQSILTSAEMSALALDRYVKGCSRVVDRNGSLAESSRGWCGLQGYPPNVTIAGKVYDVDYFFEDWTGDGFELVTL